jgi:hypothetical protein
MADTLSQFGLSLKDGVSLDELKTFIQMYSESATTPAGRQLAADYLAETEKPIAEQRLVPKLHGALIESQMRLGAQPGKVEIGQNASGLNGARPAGLASAGDEGRSRVAQAANENAPPGTETAELPFEQVRLALQRLQELQSSKNLTPAEQFQLEALKAFRAHIMDPGARDAVATNSRGMAAAGKNLGAVTVMAMAVVEWYKQMQSGKTEEQAKLL